MKFIYLASPYSHKSKKIMDYREKEITRVAAHLIKRFGYCFFLPITQSAPLSRILPELGGSFDKWKDIDLEAVKRSDEVWVCTMDGWDESIGVLAEIKYAVQRGKRVRFLSPDTLEFTGSMKTSTKRRTLNVRIRK